MYVFATLLQGEHSAPTEAGGGQRTIAPSVGVWPDRDS